MTITIIDETSGPQASRVDVYEALDVEREFQFKKHSQNHHSMGSWLLLIESELAEAKLAAVKGGTGRNSVRSELVQIAALCVAALEDHGLDFDKAGREV